MVKRVLFAAIIVASAAAAALILHMLDLMIYGTLYSYGLEFNYGWATPYWNLLKVMWVLLAIIAATAIASVLFSLRAAPRLTVERKPKVRIPLTSKTIEKAPIVTRATERPPAAFTPRPSPPSYTTTPPPLQRTQPSFSKAISAPPPITPSQSPQQSTDLPGVFRCSHCGKSFTQPLRMLDFNSDRPRVINICPFCNETTNTVAQTEEKEQKQNGKYPPSKNNHLPKTIA